MFGLDAKNGIFILDRTTIGPRIVVKLLSHRKERFLPECPEHIVDRTYIRHVLELYLPEYKRIVTFTPFSITSARASAEIASYPAEIASQPFEIESGYFQLVAVEYRNMKYKWYAPAPEKLPETKRNASWLLMAEITLQNLRNPKKLMEFDFSDTAVELEKLEAEKAELHATYRKKSIALNRKIRLLKEKN